MVGVLKWVYVSGIIVVYLSSLVDLAQQSIGMYLYFSDTALPQKKLFKESVDILSTDSKYNCMFLQITRSSATSDTRLHRSPVIK